MAKRQNSTAWAKRWVAVWAWIGQARWSGQPNYLQAWLALRPQSIRRTGSTSWYGSTGCRRISTCVCGDYDTESAKHRTTRHMETFNYTHRNCYLAHLRQITGGLSEAEVVHAAAEADLTRCRAALTSELERYRQSLAVAEQQIAALTEVRVPTEEGSRWAVLDLDA